MRIFKILNRTKKDWTINAINEPALVETTTKQDSSSDACLSIYRICLYIGPVIYLTQAHHITRTHTLSECFNHLFIALYSDILKGNHVLTQVNSDSVSPPPRLNICYLFEIKLWPKSESYLDLQTPGRLLGGRYGPRCGRRLQLSVISCLK